MDGNFLVMLDKAREIADVPFVINSGWRCEKRNKQIGATPNSAHTRGKAADIRAMDSRTRFAIIDAAREVGFMRMGLGETFIHLDSDDTLPQAVAWNYVAGV